MGEETTLLDLLPGTHNLKLFMQQYLARRTMLEAFPTHFTITHVLGALLVVAFVSVGALFFYRAVARGGEQAIVPPATFSLRLLFERFADAVLSVGEGVMGPANARRFLPLVGTFACFIFFSNLLALIPGFAPPTAILKTTMALAVVVVVMTHVYGFMEQGPAYAKHFLGPVWLMSSMGSISHTARLVSLSIRLCGNMTADHKVVFAFFSLIPFLLPVPFLILGVLVAIVQTLVFSLLTMVYIQSAVDHGHGDDHGHEDAHAH